MTAEMTFARQGNTPYRKENKGNNKRWYIYESDPAQQNRVFEDKRLV